MTLRITKEFRFEMAHALLGHDGPCRDIHGHSYRLLVTLKGTTVPNGEKAGMVFDFADLRTIVQERILRIFDHALVLNGSTSSAQLEALGDHNLVTLDFQPTCEGLCAHFAGIIQKALPADVALHHVTLYETASSFAEWYAEDNIPSET